MIIDLDSIGRSPRQIDITFDASQIELADEARLVGKVDFRGSFSREGLRTIVQGEIATDLIVDCSRCLEPVNRHFDIPFEAVFVDTDDEAADEEIRVGTEHLDESLVIDGQIDIAEVVREQIILALPETALCREDCQGLCPKCGANRNLIDCRCTDDEIDPRWAALKNLK
jgi:uncharacterized protein